MRVILFDLMDTLVIDPYHRIAREFLSDRSVQRHFFHWKNQNAFEEFERGEISEPEFFERYYRDDMPQSVRELLPPPRKIRKRLFESVRFLPGLAEVVRELAERDDVRLGIASNYSEWYALVLKKRPEIEERFDYLFFSCEMGARKPDEEYYRIIFNSLNREHPGLTGGSILFIDDREKNIAPAREFGWRVHLITNAASLRTALDEFLAKSA